MKTFWPILSASQGCSLTSDGSVCHFVGGLTSKL